VVIEQVLYGNADGGYRFLARSPGFEDDWLAEAERLCTGFGERPAGVRCPGCVFARPFGPRHVAVVQVADQGSDDDGRPGALGFRLLILPRPLYADLGSDPFHVADQYAPPWQARGDLPALTWDFGAPPPRTVADLHKVLNVPGSATLLGGAQALLDGGRVVFERTEPDARLLRGLWALLPTSTRGDLWPASFSFSNTHGFDAVVVPRATGPDFDQYVFEEQAGDYPEGRYELALQTAVESGNQHDLDTLLSRRSRRQMLRLAVGLLAVFVLVPVAGGLLTPKPPPPRSAPAAAAEKPDLPAADECPPLSKDERDRLAERLRGLALLLHFAPPSAATDPALTDAVAALDRRLGTPIRRRDPGKLRAFGPLARQLRALLWKHDVAGYQQPRRNTLEVLDLLVKKLPSVAAAEAGMVGLLGAPQGQGPWLVATTHLAGITETEASRDGEKKGEAGGGEGR
jgi:hypothetical protein